MYLYCARPKEGDDKIEPKIYIHLSDNITVVKLHENKIQEKSSHEIFLCLNPWVNNEHPLKN